jgi:hypothetical protein
LCDRLFYHSISAFVLCSLAPPYAPCVVSVELRRPLVFRSKVLKILQGGVGLPNVRWYGVEGDYNVMVSFWIARKFIFGSSKGSSDWQGY